MKDPWRYDSVFAQASLQTAGHFEEYLIPRTRHLGLFYVQPRFSGQPNLFRRYEEGVLAEERTLPSSRSMLAYYLRWQGQWNRELNRFRNGRESVTAIFRHPFSAIGMTFRRNVRHVYWQWDYFPDGSLFSRLFNAFSRFYSKRVDRYLVLTASIRRAMRAENAKVAMLGMRLPNAFGDPLSRRLLFVGQLKDGQGLEQVLAFLSDHEEYTLSLMGHASGDFGSRLRRRIEELGLEKRVNFPDRFVSEGDLRQEASRCLVALALYDPEDAGVARYADPGKVKSSIELGLPVVMTRVSDIVPFVERFHAGEIVGSADGLLSALKKIASAPQSYFEGCRRFAEHFDFNRYYGEVL